MDAATTVILSVYGASILGFYLRRIENRLDILEATMNRGFEHIGEKFERTDARLSNHGERISALEVRNLD